MLEQRIEDIEEVIDRHFLLIRLTLIQKFRDKFEKERKKDKKLASKYPWTSSTRSSRRAPSTSSR